MTLEWITTKDFNGLKRYNKMGLVKTSYAKEFIKLIIWKTFYIGYVLILPIIFLDNFSWFEILFGFLSMHFISGLQRSPMRSHIPPLTGAYQPGSPWQLPSGSMLPCRPHRGTEQSSPFHARWQRHFRVTLSQYP